LATANEQSSRSPAARRFQRKGMPIEQAQLLLEDVKIDAAMRYAMVRPM
jgi:hypothetical protein